MIEINMELWKLFIEIGNIGLLGIADFKAGGATPKEEHGSGNKHECDKTGMFHGQEYSMKVLVVQSFCYG
ncbi:hypothetical protein SDC9_181034 [bioreactor metagenome]|uniref:Uncharacterized protein n=1 Tax=bioreactor metagenome TaxID=1076179 RepID=A0A645H4Z4_9ZZZZ